MTVREALVAAAVAITAASVTRAPVDQPEPEPHSVARSGPRASGVASWFATGPNGLYGAAGPLLRRGDWRGSRVIVCVTGTGRCVRVTLNDWCACGDRSGRPTIVDLSDEAFRRLAPLSRGVIPVTVEVSS